ncbi:MAG: GIY-YIG domain-containing protein [Parcubacteria group bacterium Gr01-1014_8]|nr:MAG: GIY-YIG domain-containing protein [Parcubacteria group bacterium Gr01-1014_8]
MHYVYVLENQDGLLYVGSTNDLRRRLSEHIKGKSKFTRKHKWTLIYYEAYRAEGDARRREHQLKYRGYAKSKLRQRLSESRQDQT